MLGTRWRSPVLALSTLAFFAMPALGQDDDLRKDIEELKKGQQAILTQLEELKKLVQAGAAKPAGPEVAGKVFTIGDNPSRGVNTAKLTLVEFTDYQ